ncbi:hypothetical protein WD019_19395 [Fictibacillus sp. Mic-4]|uniref:hypothetical protein n=1 Tax=Fictibacillus sp. Mic-4 TaxID=3132826 RepID=UPI003CF58C65
MLNEVESEKVGEYVKNRLKEPSRLKAQPFKQKLALKSKGDFEMSYAGWGPDYQDMQLMILSMYTLKEKIKTNKKVAP